MLPAKVTKSNKDQSSAKSLNRHQSAHKSSLTQTTGAAILSGTCNLRKNPAAFPLPRKRTSVASLSLHSVLRPASGQGTKPRAPARAEGATGRVTSELLQQSSPTREESTCLSGMGTSSESQNGSGWKGPLWVTQSNPLPKQGHPEQAAQHRVQAGLEYLQRRRLHSLPGQPGPGLRHPQREEVLPPVQKQEPEFGCPRLCSPGGTRLGVGLRALPTRGCADAGSDLGTSAGGGHAPGLRPGMSPS